MLAISQREIVDRYRTQVDEGTGPANRENDLHPRVTEDDVLSRKKETPRDFFRRRAKRKISKVYNALGRRIPN